VCWSCAAGVLIVLIEAATDKTLPLPKATSIDISIKHASLDGIDD
jgi:hypothetical protein